jgi:hypothetical protein
VINRETLTRIATLHQTTEINIAREYCQHLFLSALYQQKGSEQVMFKGGTALKIVYGSPRFSEDLDFSGFGVSLSQIEDWILAAMGEISLSAVGVNLQESKPTSGGYLASLDYQVYDYPIRILIEISLRRQNGIQGQGVLITPDTLPAYVLTLLPESELVEEKINALLTRGKPRDFFDLYFLLRKGLITPAMKTQLENVRVTLQGSNLDFYAELAQFLPRSHLGLMRDFRTTLREELSKHGV